MISFVCCTSQDIDNISFSMGLSDTVRTRIEEAGAVRLDEAETSKLGKMKDRHVYAIVIAVICSLFAVVLTEKWGYMITLPFVTLGVVTSVEAFEAGGGPPQMAPCCGDAAANRPKRMVVAAAQCFCGFVGFAVMLLSFVAEAFLRGGTM
eukprot:SAG31_NODE_3990_length_3681_cov_2.353992_4_plen_150_part_00